MSPEKENEPEIEVTPDPVKEDPQIEISQADQPKQDSEFTKYRNRMEYQFRQYEKTTRELSEATRRMNEFMAKQATQREEVEQEPEDEIDRIAQKDWKKGVSLVMENVLKEREARQLAAAEQTRKQQQLEESKRKVLEQFPQLNDEHSDEARTYLEVLNEDQSLLTDPRGPEIAMYRMKERFQREGRILPHEKPIIEREVMRQTRTQATSVPVGRAAQNEQTKIVVTQSEKELCEANGIPLDKYVQMRNMDSQKFKEGVSVQ